MKGLKDRLQTRAGLVAFAVSAVIFGVMSVAVPHTKSTHVLIPIVKRFVAAGRPVGSGDIEWVSEATLRPVSPSALKGYAKVPLFSGSVISPQELGPFSRGTVLVAVSPASPVDAGVAVVGGEVEVLVSNTHGLAWQSGPLPVVSRTLGGGSPASVNVVMTMNEALSFERVMNRGTIELVGLPS